MSPKRAGRAGNGYPVAGTRLEAIAPKTGCFSRLPRSPNRRLRAALDETYASARRLSISIVDVSVR